MTGMLSHTELESLVEAGDIDTVIVAFCDMQGRLTGKRVSSRLFVEDVAAHGAECCNYLLAVDVDMNTVDGYAMSSWEDRLRRHGHEPDFSTTASAALATGHRAGDGGPLLDRRQPGHSAPRSILNNQIVRLPSRAGAVRRHRTGVHGLRRLLPRCLGGRLRMTASRAITTWTTRCWRRRGWSRCCATSGWA